MPRTKPPEEPNTPPCIDPTAGIILLKKQIEKANALLSSNLDNWSDHTAWSNTTRDYLVKIFGSSSVNINAVIHASSDISLHRGMSGRESQLYRNSLIENQIKMLSSCIEQLETQLQLSTPSSTRSVSSWEEELHPKIIQVSKARLDSGHYADSVEAAFKEINNAVKEIVRKATGKEHDGAALMREAFSPNKPTIVLDDLSTVSGKDVQLGYMEIYAGSMTGIRNPKAHGNLVITPDRAIHLLYLASLLMYKLEERVSP